MHDVIHDLKTERQNVSAGLPAGYKLIPAAFYVVAVAAVFLSLYFYLEPVPPAPDFSPIDSQIPSS
jgi:hypothetical protein